MKIPDELKSMLLADVRGVLGQHLNSDEEALLRCFEISISQFLPTKFPPSNVEDRDREVITSFENWLIKHKYADDFPGLHKAVLSYCQSHDYQSIPEADEWIDPNKQLPEVNTEVICKVEKLAFCVTDHAVGYIKSYPGKTVWMIEGHHVTHYKDAVNNCVIKWKPII